MSTTSIPEWKQKLFEIWDRRNANAGVWEIEELITAREDRLVERICELKTKSHTDHSDKDEWYACITCMEETNIDSTLDKAIQLIREGDTGEL